MDNKILKTLREQNDFSENLNYTGECNTHAVPEINLLFESIDNIKFLKDIYDNDFIYYVNAAPIINGLVVNEGKLGFVTDDRMSFHFYANDLVVSHGRGNWENMGFATIIKYSDIKKYIFNAAWEDTVVPMFIDITDMDVYFIIPKETTTEMKHYGGHKYDVNIVAKKLEKRFKNRVIRYDFCEEKDLTTPLDNNSYKFSKDKTLCLSLRNIVNKVLNNIFKNNNKFRVIKMDDNAGIFAFIDIRTNVVCTKTITNPIDNYIQQQQGDNNTLEGTDIRTLLRFVNSNKKYTKNIDDTILKILMSISSDITLEGTCLYDIKVVNNFFLNKLIPKIPSPSRDLTKLFFDCVIFYRQICKFTNNTLADLSYYSSNTVSSIENIRRNILFVSGYFPHTTVGSDFNYDEDHAIGYFTETLNNITNKNTAKIKANILHIITFFTDVLKIVVIDNVTVGDKMKNISYLKNRYNNIMTTYSTINSSFIQRLQKKIRKYEFKLRQ